MIIKKEIVLEDNIEREMAVKYDDNGNLVAIGYKGIAKDFQKEKK